VIRAGAKTQRIVALGLALVAAWSAPLLAQTKTGTTMGAFLQIEPSARVAGMGNAGVALAQGLDAVYFNPAAISGVDHHAITFTHSAWLADIRYDYVAAAIPVGKWGSAYAAVTSLNSGDMIVRTVSQPLGTGERFSVSDVGIALGYGRQITDRFAAGGQITYAQETIWHSSASTFTLSVGTTYRVADNGLHIGASLSNFGTQTGYDGRDLRITYDQDPNSNGDNGTLPGEIVTGDFPVPVLFRIGIGAPFQLAQNARLTLEIDALHPNDNSESMSMGSELLLNRQFSLRAGFQNAFQTDSEEGLTAGAGFNSRWQNVQYHVDYAWADHGRLGNVSRLTLGFGF
jgi:hypothetical protein